ncbi:dTDP-4-amino-4,6-dideoxygalactose transaminase [Glycomyces sambucus]|uniref:dTDP-4-amino-4,6-dideoxygalactose transaminase n=1 Tax=Glycomyces sambucus TaxID=380244 RepID=A0A1G9LVF9_9ACTN|nr:DegT/DnrJ/EryC1/StrS family aminotransferase [Glycomyces sambucus]SDL66082.1 dTDP-4-amino-4,6-dideoxygalactose transaminase [Glycomyces sambucus]
MTSPLALLGGTSAIDRPGPHFTWPPITDATRKAVADQLDTAVSIYDRSGVIADLEDALATYFGVRYALLTSSGTAALYSMYAAAGIGPGMEVIVPAYTFFATVTPLLHVGATPVLAECDERGNLDPADVLTRITHRTRAIAVTHMWGAPADVIELRRIADLHGLRLFEDGSHAHGATAAGRKIGSFGDAAAFSMNGPKPLSAGEGGFLLTDDSEIHHRALLHGQYNKRCRNEIPKTDDLYRYAVTGMGLKHRIHPLAAAMGLEQLGNLDTYLAGRDETATYLRDQLSDIPGIEPIAPAEGDRSSWYGLILRYRPDQLNGLTLDHYFEALQAEGALEADRPGSTCPLNLLPLFQEPGPLFPTLSRRFAYAPGQFPRAEAFHADTIKLPVWHRVDDQHTADAYLEAFRKVSAHHTDLIETGAQHG